MTIPTEVLKVGPTVGDGIATTFPGGTMQLLDESHVRVVKSSNNIDTDQTVTTDYTVTYNATTRLFSVEMNTAPTSSEYITLLYNVPADQDTDYGIQGPYNPEFNETDFDLQTTRDAEYREKLSRALLVSLTSTSDPADLVAVLEGLAPGGVFTLPDSSFTLVGDVDSSKAMRFEVDTYISTSTTRTYTGPDIDGILGVGASFTAGAVLFAGTSNDIDEAPGLLDWNGTNNALEIGVPSSAYPGMQFYVNGHDDMAIGLDAYFANSFWRSSDPTSNFRIQKAADDLIIDMAVNETPGNPISDWDCIFEATESLVHINDSAHDRSFRVDASGIQNAVYVLGSSGDVGIGGTTTPGSTGNAKLEIYGTDSSNTAVPALQFLTTTDVYPQMQVYPFTHDNLAIYLDAYRDTTGTDRSSDVGSNFGILKAADTLSIVSSTGIAQGSPIAWTVALAFDTAGKYDSGAFVIDDDTMATASDDTVSTSESVKAYVDAQVAVAGALNVNDFIYVREEQASGVNGQNCTASTWNIRLLNTVVTNTIAGASLIANVVNLPAGTYYIEAGGSASSVFGALNNSHQIRCRDTTGATTVALGTSAIAGQNLVERCATDSTVFGTFTLAGLGTIRLEHWTSQNVTNGFGNAVNSGENEVYGWMKIWKTA